MSRILRRRKCNQHQCILEMNGELRTSIQLTTNEEVTIIVWGSSSCTLRILAIGGGGGSLGDEANFSFSGGGGSGYIRYYSSSVFAGALELTAQVGLGGTEITDGSPSTVRMPGTTITARGGQCGRGVSGGDGYSGGRHGKGRKHASNTCGQFLRKFWTFFIKQQFSCNFHPSTTLHYYPQLMHFCSRISDIIEKIGILGPLICLGFI